MKNKKLEERSFIKTAIITLLWSLIPLVLLSNLSGFPQGYSKQIKEKIRSLVEDFGKAFVKADVETLEAYLTKDYIHTNTGGGVLDKKMWLKWIRSRREDLNKGKIKIESYVNDEVQVKLYGDDTAIVTGRNTTTGIRDGVAFSTQIRFTHVWIRNGDKWQRAAFHDTRITRN